LKATIIGLGYIAEKHIEVLNALNCKITGVYSRNYKKTITKSNSFKIKKVYENLDDIDTSETDFFILAVSAENNEDVLKKLLKFRKPILMEKPATFRSTNLKKIIDKNQDIISRVMVGVNRRFYSVFDYALTFLKDNDKKLNAVFIEAPERFSDIALPKFNKFVKDNWMYANPIHCIDLIRFFVGEIKTMDVNSIPSKYYFSAIGHGSKNIEFTYLSNWKSLGKWSVTLYADDIRINFNPLEVGTIITKNQTQKILPSKEDQQFKPGFYHQMEYFIKNVLGRKKVGHPASDLADHLNTLKLIEKIFKKTQ